MFVINLALHGGPPIDFPTNETVELFNLHAWLEHAAKKRAWPSVNDTMLLEN